MAQVSANHVLAGRPDHIPLDVVGDSVSKPKGQRASPRPAGELGDEGVAGANRSGEVADEGLKERLPSLVRGSFDDDAQCGNQRWRAGSHHHRIDILVRMEPVKGRLG